MIGAREPLVRRIKVMLAEPGRAIAVASPTHLQVRCDTPADVTRFHAHLQHCRDILRRPDIEVVPAADPLTFSVVIPT